MDDYTDDFDDFDDDFCDDGDDFSDDFDGDDFADDDCDDPFNIDDDDGNPLDLDEDDWDGEYCDEDEAQPDEDIDGAGDQGADFTLEEAFVFGGAMGLAYEEGLADGLRKRLIKKKIVKPNPDMES